MQPPDPEVVQAVTYGEIRPTSSIVVSFTEPVGAAGQPAESQAVAVEPRMAGSVSWDDDWTLRFTPAEAWQRGREYRVTVDPRKVGVEAEPFGIPVYVPERRIAVTRSWIEIADPENRETVDVVAEVTGVDGLSAEELRESARVSGAPAGAELLVATAGEPGRAELRLRNVPRPAAGPDGAAAGSGEAAGSAGAAGAPGATGASSAAGAAGAGSPGGAGVPGGARARSVTLGFDERALEAAEVLAATVSVPPAGRFELLDVFGNSDGGRSAELIFSEAIDPQQDLRGLIHTAAFQGLEPVVRGNRVRLYADREWPSELELTVEPEVRSSGGVLLAQAEQRQVAFSEEDPAVRFVGSGTIVPTSQGTIVPIETMNLRQVMVEAIHVLGGNMHQFLQVNTLDGDSELERVGTVAWRKVVDLDWREGYRDRWTRYGLDLSELVEEYDEGMFQLRLTFRRQHIEYRCDFEAPPEDATFRPWPTGPDDREASNWDLWEEGSFWEAYQNRENPCHPGYYGQYGGHDIRQTRNVLISNLGLMAQQSPTGEMVVHANDIRSAAPAGGVEVAAFTYQNKELARGRTDAQGRLELALEEEVPFYLLGSSDEGRAYLRVDSGSARAVSHFDVGGARVVGGVDGFVFGERDIWRPGDEIYLHLLLHDPEDALPDDHPVDFSLVDPMGQVVERQVVTQNLDGFYPVTARTAADAPTGTYRGVFRIGNRSFDKVLRVETVRPNRLSIDVELGSGEGPVGTGRIPGSISSQWLHGAPADGLRAQIEANYSPASTSFPGYESYTFDDPAREFRAPTEMLFEGWLDGSGEAEFQTNISIPSAPGRVTANLTSRVFEPGGNFSVQYTSKLVDPYERYLGVQLPPGDAARGMLLTDEDHPVRIAMVTDRGEPVERATVDVELYKLQWRWWWATDQDEDVTSYIEQRSVQPIEREEVEIREGRGEWTLRVEYPSWGRYLVRVIDGRGHSTGEIFYIDWPGWAGRQQGTGGGAATVLPLAPERPEYEVGEEVAVTVPTGAMGRALATVERGGEVLDAQWLEPEEGGTIYRFRATAGMAPNIYVHVTYLQPHQQTANDRPIRSYGVVPVAVNDPSTVLRPELAMPAEYKPGEIARMQVSEESGRAMTYVVAVVDEGLLGLTNYNVPDPRDHFYRRQASMLQSWDVYDHVAGAFTGDLARLLAIGGGDQGELEGRREQNRFEPVVHVFEPRRLAAGRSDSLEFRMPNYVGAVRVMAVAAREGAFGAAQSTVPVRQEVMVLTSLPRVLTPGDTVDVPITVFSLAEGSRTVEVEVSASGAGSLAGRGSFRMRFDGSGDRQERVSVQLDDRPGTLELRAVARSGSAESTTTTEVAVRSAQPDVRETREISVPAEGSETVSLSLPGLPGTNSVTVELSATHAMDLTRRLDYLLAFPYGCIEQTVSSVFPQIYLPELVELSPAREREVRQNVLAGIERIDSFRTGSGGLSYWPGQSAAHEWGTNYALHFLLAARDAGYPVSEELLNPILEYQKREANRAVPVGSTEEHVQAYRLLTLALAGEPDRAAMNRLRERPTLETTARWHLAQAYAWIGLRRQARESVAGAGTDIRDYRELSGSFGSGLRDRAIVLQTAVLLQERQTADRLAREISRELTSEEQLTTQETAYALLAMADYALAGEGDRTIDAAVRWNGRIVQRVQSDRPIVQVEVPVGDSSSGRLTVENNSARTLFPRVAMKGTPEQGSEMAVSSGIAIATGYDVGSDGRGRVQAHRVGDEIVQTVRVVNMTSRTLEELALSTYVPAGWEILNARLAGRGSAEQIDYQDVRDDRVDTFFDLEPRQSKTFELRATAAYAGRFYLPAIRAQAMYDPSITAVTPGEWIEIEAAE